MTFSEFALGLFPFISCGDREPVFFRQLIGNFVKDAAQDACILLKRKDDTKYRYIKGDRAIQRKDAQYLYEHRDKNKFSDWICQQMDESDSYESVREWLDRHGIADGDPSDACADLLERILLDIIGVSDVAKAPFESELDLNLINDIQEKIRSLPRPASVPVPEEATKNEQTYIEELCHAYGDAEGMDMIPIDQLPVDYLDDLEDRRVDFYAAESIRRGVLELKSDALTGQFEVLKEETYNNVSDTSRKVFPNGYERMLAVMEQAVNAQVENYILGKSPYWISSKIKKGACHHLVNDGKLRWVRRRKRNA